MQKKHGFFIGIIMLLAAIWVYTIVYRSEGSNVENLKIFSLDDRIIAKENIHPMVKRTQRTEKTQQEFVSPEGDCFVTGEAFYEATGELVVCDSIYNHPVKDDTYDSYSDASLERMSYSDAGAAFELGKRLSWIEDQKAMMLLIRSSALNGGSYEPFEWLENNRYAQTKVDGVIVLDNYKTKYVLLGASVKLGGDGVTTQKSREHFFLYLRAFLIDIGITEAELANLEHQSRQILAHMQDVEYEIKGTSILKRKISEYNNRS